MQAKPNIKTIDRDILVSFLASHNEAKFRLKQIYYWLFSKNVTEFNQMTNLSSKLRDKLSDTFQINSLIEKCNFGSKDGSIRYIFKTYDETLTESVLINNNGRIAACISSQVGCSLSCKFCATGYLKYKRNLHASEIYEQAYILNQKSLEYFRQPLSNIVYMGMGEPLLNYKNVLQSIKYISCNDAGLGLSPKRVTISTAGIAKIISLIAKNSPKTNLALSLHAPCDKKRSQIMPINDTNSIDALIQALKYYYKVTKNLITIEYILFDRFNDSLEDAKKLLSICKKVPSKVNLIEYNPIDSFKELSQSSRATMEKFQNVLTASNVITTLRYSKGSDIAAACGQLAYKLTSNQYQ